MELGKITNIDIQNRYGAPDNVYYLNNSKIVVESDEMQWIYKQKDMGCLYLLFDSGVLVFKNWTFGKKGGEEKEIKSLLRSSSEWEILTEPMSNLHRAPSDCYLEDLKLGQRIKFNGPERRVDEVSRWIPSSSDKSIRSSLSRNVGREFCIAGSCSKINDPNTWKTNHCAWLSQLARKKKAIYITKGDPE